MGFSLTITLKLNLTLKIKIKLNQENAYKRVLTLPPLSGLGISVALVPSCQHEVLLDRPVLQTEPCFRQEAATGITGYTYVCRGVDVGCRGSAEGDV